MKKPDKKYLPVILGAIAVFLLFLWLLFSSSRVPTETVHTEPIGPKPSKKAADKLLSEPSVSAAPSVTPAPVITPTPSPLPSPSPTPVPETAPENQETAMIQPPSHSESSIFSKASEIWTAADYLFIGDSRTHAMADVTRGRGTWIYKDGAGYDWMVNTAFPEAEKTIGEGTAVIIAMGVNDVHHCSQYIEAINDKTAQWKEKGAKVFFASVGPVTSDPYVTNEEILHFNTELYHNLDAVYLDVYNHLALNGFVTTDGIHYDSATTRSVYQFLIDHIGSGGARGF